MSRFTLITLLAIMLFSCNEQRSSHTPSQQEVKTMNSIVSILEIPATDIPRAIRFYQTILDVKIEELNFPGMHMGLFPVEHQATVGVIITGEEAIPSANGVTVYLNAGSDLQVVLDKVEQGGGQIKVPKTPHADESGFFALFIDSEGNRLGLHSTN